MNEKRTFKISFATFIAQAQTILGLKHGDVVEYEGQLFFTSVAPRKDRDHMAVCISGEEKGYMFAICGNSYIKATKVKAQLKIEHHEE